MSTPESSNLVYIWADESCLGNQFSDQPRPGGAAGLLEVFDEQRGWTRRDYYVSEPDTTNQRMAVRSAIEGLSSLKQHSRVVFYSDSQYLIHGMSEWICDWARRGWKRKGGRIENLEFWAKLVLTVHRPRKSESRALPHEIEWRWVRGHSGQPKHEYVNLLAIGAAEHQKTSRGLVKSGFDSWLTEQQNQDHFLEFLDLPPEQPFNPGPAPPAAPPESLL